MKKVKYTIFPLVLILFLSGGFVGYHAYSHYMVSQFFKYIDAGYTEGTLTCIEKMPSVNMRDSCAPIYFLKLVSDSFEMKGYPLDYAVYKEVDISVYEALLKKGADPNKKGYGKSPFQVLCRNIQEDWDKKIMLFVEYGADIKSVNLSISEYFREHLDETKEMEFKAIVYLWENGGGFSNANQTTALHRAARCLETKYLDELYHNENRSMKFLLNTRDEDGETPIFRAVRRNYYDNCEFLVNEGADLTVKNNEGKTAYDVAVELGYEECAELLRSNILNNK